MAHSDPPIGHNLRKHANDNVAMLQGNDPRGSGHFVYGNVPELEAVLGFAPDPLRCSNR